MADETVTLSITMPADLHADAKALAERQERSLAQFIRFAMKEQLEVSRKKRALAGLVVERLTEDLEPTSPPTTDTKERTP